jgi:hypothetical protein
MGSYHVAQVCENGHATSGRVDDMPEHRASFCGNCGAATITACGNCGVPIRGRYESDSFVVLGAKYTPPNYCHACGRPYPWTEKALQAGRDLADDTEGLTPEERERLKRSLEDVTSDNPNTEVAAGWIRKVAQRLGGSTGQLIEKVATTVATEAAKRIILGGP